MPDRAAEQECLQLVASSKPAKNIDAIVGKDVEEARTARKPLPRRPKPRARARAADDGEWFVQRDRGGVEQSVAVGAPVIDASFDEGDDEIIAFGIGLEHALTTDSPPP